MTRLLARIGVDYPNTPTSPALLAYLRGAGVNLSTAADEQRTALSRIRTGAQEGRQDIRRAAGRAKEAITTDLLSRGVLSSGESNERYLRQGQDVAEQRSDLARETAGGREDVTTAYNRLVEGITQGTYEQVAAEDERQQVEAGTNRVLTRGANRARRATVNQNDAAQQALQDQFERQLELIRQYGRQGTA